MPQSVQAAASVWGAEQVSARRAEARLQNVAPLDQDTRLAWLADVIASRPGCLGRTS